MQVRRITHALAAVLTLLFSAVPSVAQNFNVDLGAPWGTPSSSYTGAAGQRGTWNTIGSRFARLAGLDGALTDVYATVTAASYDGNASGCDEEAQSLTGDNIYTIGGSWSVVLDGLLNGDYTLYLYAPNNTIVPTGAMTVNGVAVASIRKRSCALAENADYVRVPVTIGDGTLTIRGESAGPGSSAGLAGLQLVQTTVVPREKPALLTVTTFAGMAEPSDSNPPGGAVDGPGPQSRFGFPFGLASDAAGNVYIADTQNHTIRRLSRAGAVTTLAGVALRRGDADGPASVARFHQPNGVALDRDGNVYVADTYNHTIRRVTPQGVVSTFAGLAGKPGKADGPGSAARFRSPFGIATDASGNVFVGDTQNHTIRRITPEGVVTTLAGLAQETGSSDGAGSAARFNFPAGLATDSAGNVYVADYVNHTIRKITPDGNVSTLAGLARAFGTANGSGSAARFSNPAGLAIDGDGNIYVADQTNNAVRRVTPSGETTTIAGNPPFIGNQDGIGAAARFYYPSGVALDRDGNLYVTDMNHASIRKITPAAMVSTIAGGEPSSGHLNGTGTDARFDTPAGLAFDAAGNLYVADSYNGAIRKVTPGAVVTTFAFVHGPHAVAVDSANNVYVASGWTHTIRKITPAGATSVLAGSSGVAGSADGTGTAAQFRNPLGIAVDAGGNVYVADTENYTIRKITPAGVVTTFAGAPGISGAADGAAAEARFENPLKLAFDRNGNLFVSDGATIRRITPDGVVSTFAGRAGEHGHRDGPIAEARLGIPTGIAFDRDGNLWFADSGSFGGGSHTIRRITPGGIVSTPVGLPGVIGSADGAGTEARFNFPGGVAAGPDGSLYVADTLNDSIRKITPTLADTATIDRSVSAVEVTRVLGSSPATATAWRWSIIRQPAGSVAALSSAAVPAPTFTPDVPGLYTFRLVATGPAGASITTVDLEVSDKELRRRVVRH